MFLKISNAKWWKRCCDAVYRRFTFPKQVRELAAACRDRTNRISVAIDYHDDSLESLTYVTGVRPDYLELALPRTPGRYLAHLDKIRRLTILSIEPNRNHSQLEAILAKCIHEARKSKGTKQFAFFSYTDRQGKTAEYRITEDSRMYSLVGFSNDYPWVTLTGVYPDETLWVQTIFFTLFDDMSPEFEVRTVKPNRPWERKVELPDDEDLLRQILEQLTESNKELETIQKRNKALAGKANALGVLIRDRRAANQEPLQVGEVERRVNAPAPSPTAAPETEKSEP